MESPKILKDTDAERHSIPPFSSSDSPSESLLEGAAYERGLDEISGIRFDAISVTGRENDHAATGLDFVGLYYVDIDDESINRPVQGHYDLDAQTAWIQFLD